MLRDICTHSEDALPARSADSEGRHADDPTDGNAESEAALRISAPRVSAAATEGKVCDEMAHCLCDLLSGSLRRVPRR